METARRDGTSPDDRSPLDEAGRSLPPTSDGFAGVGPSGAGPERDVRLSDNIRQSGGDLLAALGRIDRELARLRGEPSSQSLEVAQRLVRLERESLYLSQQVELLDESAALGAARPVKDDLADWARLAAWWDLPAAAADAERATGRLFEDDLVAWNVDLRRRLDAMSLDDLFAEILQAGAFELDAQKLDSANPPGLAIIEIARGDLRREFLERQGREPPTPAQRSEWATELVDRTDAALTAADDQKAAPAARRLTVALADLDWHLQYVETTRTPDRRRLRRRRKKVYGERIERRLQTRLEATFGAVAFARFERLVLFSIFFVLGLLVVHSISEFHFTSDSAELFWFEVVDASVCGVLLLDFFVRWALVEDRWFWFKRNWLFGLLPSIPFGLLAHLMPANWIANDFMAGELAKLLRLPQLIRYAVVLRPLVRLLRFVGFLTRGLDRLARKLSPILNQNIILYPTREERQQAEIDPRSLARMHRRIRFELADRWKAALEAAPSPEVAAEVVAARTHAFLIARDDGLTKHSMKGRVQGRMSADLTAERLFDHLQTITPQDVEHELGELAPRLARFVRTCARPPVSWLPIVSACVPRIDRQTTDSEAIAQATRRTSSLLKEYHDRWFFTADLYGTVTPSQFVDRVGLILIKSSMRPVYRLMIFGGLFVGVNALLYLLPFEPTEALEGLVDVKPIVRFVDNLLGTTLALVGVISVFTLGLGFWMRRLAREATEFYERSAHAQFLALTEIIRCRTLERDAKILFDRVLRPELLLFDFEHPVHLDGLCSYFTRRLEQSLMGRMVDDMPLWTSATLERIVLLYRDSLDGALFVDNDTRTTSQLLGNPALQQLIANAMRRDKPTAKDLEQLDLDRLKGLVGGPYIWFNFICQAIAHSTAQLIIDYNRHAIPLEELPYSLPGEKDRLNKWLDGKSSPVGDDVLIGDKTPRNRLGMYKTTFFTALHVLDVDSVRDEEVERIFGKRVLDRLRKDRGQMIRRIFGMYPLHELPKERRVMNLASLYEDWLAGGKALLLPLFLFGESLKQGKRLLIWLWHSIAEIRNPALRVDPKDAADADFSTAMRKIDRMRGPVVYASTLLRCRVDPEYLGVRLPGFKASTIEGADVDADVDFLKPDAEFLERLQEERARAEADMRRLNDLIETGLFERLGDMLDFEDPETARGPEYIRAAACAYLADLYGIRRCLSAHEVLKEVFESSARSAPLPPKPGFFWGLRGKFNRYWKQHGTGDRQARLAAWRAVVHNVWGSADALKAINEYGDLVRIEGERRLAMLIRHPQRVTEHLTTLRAVQTTAILDVLTYREHVFALGGYEALGDKAGSHLTWGRVNNPDADVAPPNILIESTTSPAIGEAATAR